MEARSATALSDVTPTGSQTHVLTPDEIPDQVMCLDLQISKEKKNYQMNKRKK